MLFDTPKTLEAALVVINLYDDMYWELYSACLRSLTNDNHRIQTCKLDGRKVARSGASRAAEAAMKSCDGRVDAMRRWMVARELGGMRPTELAIHTFRLAELAHGDIRQRHWQDLNALLDTLEPDEWSYAVALEGRWGGDIIKRFCLHVARRMMARENVA